jgi:hypothetical protein
MNPVRAILRIFAPLAGLALLAGCRPQAAPRLYYDMGERVEIGPLTYVVVESAWFTQLGELFQVRVPQHRFLTLRLSVTNGGGSSVSVPLLQLEAPNGQAYRELEDGSSVSGWFGLFRTIAPAQTAQGTILFDVPLTSYRLRLPDVSEGETDAYAWVDIPLRLDAEQIQSPLPGGDQILK